MHLVGWVYGVVLTASVLANVYLLAPGDTVSESAVREPPQSDLTGVRSRVSAPTTPPQLVAQRSATPERQALERRVAAAEAEVLALLPGDERFELATASEESEARLRPALERAIIAVGGAVEDVEVECRADVCRVLPLTAAMKELMSAWFERLRADSFGLVYATVYTRSGTYFELASEGREAGFRWSNRVFIAFRAARAGVTCARTHPEPKGYVELTLTLAGGVDVAGPLAAQPVAICARRALEDVIANDPMPPDATEFLPRPLRVEVR